MKKCVKEYRSTFEKHSVISNLEKINQKILEPNFWEDKTNAQKIFKKKKFLEDLVSIHKKSIIDIKDLSDLFKLANEENNNSNYSQTKSSSKLADIFVNFILTFRNFRPAASEGVKFCE